MSEVFVHCGCGLAMYALPDGAEGMVYICEDCDPHAMPVISLGEPEP